MKADAPAILRLYREMIGEEQPEDLSHVWPVRLGEATEALNLEWFERANRCVLTRKGEVVVHPLFSWAAATLDGWYGELRCPVECKHIGGREPIEVVIDRYQPQMQWQCEVTGAEQVALSIIAGADAPRVEFIERDGDYAAEMMRRGLQFMECVRKRKPPVELPPAPPPAPPAIKTYDMTGSNEWASSAFVWIESKPHADRCSDAEKILKSLVPQDAKLCEGHGVRISRNKAGALSLREAT